MMHDNRGESMWPLVVVLLAYACLFCIVVIGSGK